MSRELKNKIKKFRGLQMMQTKGWRAEKRINIWREGRRGIFKETILTGDVTQEKSELLDIRTKRNGTNIFWENSNTRIIPKVNSPR